MSRDMQPVMSLSSGSFICCTRLGLSAECGCGEAAPVVGTAGSCGGLGAPAVTTTTVGCGCCGCCCGGGWPRLPGATLAAAGGRKDGCCSGNPGGAAVGETLAGGAFNAGTATAAGGPCGLAATAPHVRGCSCSIFFWTTICCAMAHAFAHTSPVLRATVRCAAACTCAQTPSHSHHLVAIQACNEVNITGMCGCNSTALTRRLHQQAHREGCCDLRLRYDVQWMVSISGSQDLGARAGGQW